MEKEISTKNCQKSPPKKETGAEERTQNGWAIRKRPWFHNRIEGSHQPTVMALGLYLSIIAKFDFKPETDLQYFFQLSYHGPSNGFTETELT